MVVSYHVVAGFWTQDLWKNSPLNHWAISPARRLGSSKFPVTSILFPLVLLVQHLLNLPLTFLPCYLLWGPLVFTAQDSCGQPFWGSTFPFLLHFGWFSPYSSKFYLSLSLGDSLSHFPQFLACANLKVPPHLPLLSHWPLMSLLINQKPTGDKDL